MDLNELKTVCDSSRDRVELIRSILDLFSPQRVAEVGVYRGELAREIIGARYIREYLFVDPWRNLDDWNKPANLNDQAFEKYKQEAIQSVADHKDKLKVLQGKTTEVVGRVEDASLDGVYIDGDHTLRGIIIDLFSWERKLKPGGFILGDDCSAHPWQHSSSFEPTFVFPVCVHFAEAIHSPIVILPFRQFLIVPDRSGFRLHNFTAQQYSTGLHGKVCPPLSRLVRQKVGRALALVGMDGVVRRMLGK